MTTQTDWINSDSLALHFDAKTCVFEEECDDRSDDEKTLSVGSACNTHTKQWNPTVNDKNTDLLSLDFQAVKSLKTFKNHNMTIQDLRSEFVYLEAAWQLERLNRHFGIFNHKAA